MFGSGDGWPVTTRSVSLEIVVGPTRIPYRTAVSGGATGVGVTAGAALSGGAGGLIGCVRLVVSRPSTATRSYRDISRDGTGRNARKAPFGHTGADCPLMNSAALPLPIDPKMKFESREATTEFAVG